MIRFATSAALAVLILAAPLIGHAQDRQRRTPGAEPPAAATGPAAAPPPSAQTPAAQSPAAQSPATPGSPARAAAASQSPNTGSFQQSCRNIAFDGTTLSAECLSGKGAWRSSALASLRCSGDIGNGDGLLICNGAAAQDKGYVLAQGAGASALPSGSYSQTCRDLRAAGGTLSGSCEDSSGRLRSSRLAYAGCRGDIGNTNGQLVCTGGTTTGDDYVQPAQPPQTRRTAPTRQTGGRDNGYGQPDSSRGGYSPPAGYGGATYGQPTYERPAYGTPTYGQPGYGQPGYGQPSYGQPSYGQSSYGQPAYGQPSYGQPSSGKPAYGQPGYGQPNPPRGAYGYDQDGYPLPPPPPPSYSPYGR